MFQELFNGINKFSIKWILTPIIALWNFESPSGLQLPKWEFTWECVGSFSHTFLHFQEHEIWLLSFHSWPTPLQALALVAKPKTRVATRSKLLVRNDSPMGLWAIHYISWWPPWHLGYGPHPIDLEFHNQYQDHLILLIHYVNSHIMVLTICI
jgi:hypothetical protein